MNTHLEPCLIIFSLNLDGGSPQTESEMPHPLLWMRLLLSTPCLPLLKGEFAKFAADFCL